jgi:hypothetical protein
VGKQIHRLPTIQDHEESGGMLGSLSYVAALVQIQPALLMIRQNGSARDSARTGNYWKTLPARAQAMPPDHHP